MYFPMIFFQTRPNPSAMKFRSLSGNQRIIDFFTDINKFFV